MSQINTNISQSNNDFVELSLAPKDEDSYSAEPVNHLKTPVFNWSDMYSAH